MGSRLGDLPIHQDDDEVGHADGGEAVRHEDSDASGLPCCHPRRLGEPLEERVLGLRIQGSRRFVQQEQQRPVPHERTSQRKPLPLPARDVHSAAELLAQLGVEPVRQRRDDRLSVSTDQRGLDGVLLGHALDLPDADHLTRRQLVLHEVLEASRDPLPPRVRLDLTQVGAVDQDAAGRRIVESCQELDERGLPGTVLAHQRDGGSGRQL